MTADSPLDVARRVLAAAEAATEAQYEVIGGQGGMILARGVAHAEAQRIRDNFERRVSNMDYPPPPTRIVQISDGNDGPFRTLAASAAPVLASAVLDLTTKLAAVEALAEEWTGRCPVPQGQPRRIVRTAEDAAAHIRAALAAAPADVAVSP